MAMPEKNTSNAVAKFRPGQSGNPRGRPRGVANKTTQDDSRWRGGAQTNRKVGPVVRERIAC